MADDDNHDDDKTPTLRRPSSRTVSGVIEITKRVPGVDELARLHHKVDEAHKRIDKMSALLTDQSHRMDQFVTPAVNAAINRSNSFGDMMLSYQQKMDIFLSRDIPKMSDALERFQDRLELVISNAELTATLSEERHLHVAEQLKSIRSDVMKLKSDTDSNQIAIASLRRSSLSWWRNTILVAAAAAAAGSIGVVASWILNHV